MEASGNLSEDVGRAFRRVVGAEWRAASAGGAIVVLATVVLFRIWELHPRVPVAYSGDAVLAMGAFKNMLLSGWYSSSDLVGVPFGQNLHDFPAVGDLSHLLLSWLLVVAGRDLALALNVFFFMSYLTVFLGSYVGSRMLRIGRNSAVAVGVLYAFLPFHYLHGPGHLFLASYGSVPLWTALAVRQLGDQPLVETLPSLRCPRDWPCWFRRPSHLAAIGIVLLGSTTGIYYAVFMMATFVVIGVVAATARSDPRRATVMVGLSLASVAVVAAQFAPTWWLHRRIGSNSEIIERGLHNIEYYSLKLIDLVLPVPGHRLGWFSGMRAESLKLMLLGERAQEVGVVGVVGLVILAGVAVVRLVRGQPGERHGALGLVAGSSFVLATVGGGATVVGALGFSFLRAWSRISVVIAFCAFAAVGLLFDRLAQRVGAVQANAIIAFVVVLGVLDTNPGSPLASYDDTAASWSSDRAFVQEVEGLIGLDASLFQIPVVPFPEHPPVHRMVDYDHLRGYLHSDTLGWSYGGVKGRAADWQQRLVGLPLDELAVAVAGAGFDGLWVDRYGYADPDVVEAYLGEADLVSVDGRLVVYDLRPIRETLLAASGTEGVDRVAAALTEPVTPRFGKGFHGVEVDAGRVFAWAPERARLDLSNPTTTTRTVVVAFVVASAVDGEWIVELSGLAERQRLPLGAAGTAVSVAVDVPPGGGSLELVSDAPRLTTTDPRDIRFRVLDPIVELPPAG